MARAVYWDIDTIDKLDCIEYKKAKAKYARIAEQSAEAIYQSSTEEAGSIVAQKV